jgi:hypothetical protein
MYTNDTRFGSTSDRYHIFGIPPYNTFGRVPALSHYLNDMVPYYLCCEWSDLCDSYLFVRETADCKGYRYPKTGDSSLIYKTKINQKNILFCKISFENSCYLW